MDNETFIKRSKDICEKSNCKLLIAIYSKSNEECVKKSPDEGQCYHSPIYTVVYELSKKSNRKMTGFYDLERELETHINKEELEAYESLKKVLKRLDLDPSDIIYKDETYKEPDKIVTSLSRIGLDINIITNRIYSISITYEELKKININKSGMFYESDLFNTLCDNDEEIKRLTVSLFPTYSTKELKETRYDEKGLTFYFIIKVENNVLNDSLNITGKTRHGALLKAFEEEGLDKDIKDMFETIIQLDEHTLEDSDDI